MKKEWKTLLAVFGIALLSAAVALMPACDTSESCDLDLETLNGNWLVTMTPEEGPSEEMIISFEVAGDILIVTIPSDPPEIVELDLDCGGNKVRLYMSVPIEEVDFGLFDCAANQTQSTSVTFSSPDDFSGTQTQAVSLTGTDCEDFKRLLQTMDPDFYAEIEAAEQGITVSVTGTRIIN